jgi:AcrR family transcriptional regulator
MAQVNPPTTTRPPGRPSEGARDALLDAAGELFVERDYADVSIAEILERAGVSRGALYHHFDGKRALYRAVWMRMEGRLLERLAGAAPPSATPYETLRAGCLAYLDEAGANSEVQRIGLLQSRTVLGWEEWREGVQELGLGAMRAAVQAAIEAGELRGGDPEAIAHLVLASLIESGLLVATADDPAAARAAVEPAFTALLEGLRARVH